MFGMMNDNPHNDTKSQKQNYERLRWLHSILIEKNTHSNNLEFLNESTSFLETISRLYNPHQAGIWTTYSIEHKIVHVYSQTDVFLGMPQYETLFNYLYPIEQWD